jgi:hypothetical protein
MEHLLARGQLQNGTSGSNCSQILTNAKQNNHDNSIGNQSASSIANDSEGFVWING